MNEVIEKTDWPQFLRSYSEKHSGRPTRLGVFERKESVFNDYWLEDGLPFIGADVDQHDDQITIEIVLGSYTHTIAEPAELSRVGDSDPAEEGLDILDRDGNTTVLRFEPL